MSTTKNYGWAYVHPTASQAQARGVDKSIQFLTGAVDSNGIGLGSGSAKFTFDAGAATASLSLTGKMTASSHISASQFYGNGATLTGIASFPFSGDAVISGNLNVTGSITASNYVIENTVEINNAGSSKFGNTNDDKHVFTGSVFIGSSGSNVDVEYKLASSQLKVPGLQVNYRTISTTTFTASASDYIVGLSNASAITLRLLDASVVGAGSLLVVKDEVGNPRANPNEITISASSGQTVDGGTHTQLGAGSRVSVTLYSNGVDKWFII